MDKWNYKQEYRSSKRFDLLKYLKEEGRMGWELLSIERGRKFVPAPGKGLKENDWVTTYDLIFKKLILN